MERLSACCCAPSPDRPGLGTYLSPWFDLGPEVLGSHTPHCHGLGEWVGRIVPRGEERGLGVWISVLVRPGLFPFPGHVSTRPALSHRPLLRGRHHDSHFTDEEIEHKEVICLEFHRLETGELGLSHNEA